jgi:hypothetical protein
MAAPVQVPRGAGQEGQGWCKSTMYACVWAPLNRHEAPHCHACMGAHGTQGPDASPGFPCGLPLINTQIPAQQQQQQQHQQAPRLCYSCSWCPCWPWPHGPCLQISGPICCCWHIWFPWCVQGAVQGSRQTDSTQTNGLPIHLWTSPAAVLCWAGTQTPCMWFTPKRADRL